MMKTTPLLALASIATSCQVTPPAPSYRLEQNVPACEAAAADASDAERAGINLDNLAAHLAWHATEPDGEDTSFRDEVCRELAQIVVSYCPNNKNLFETVEAAETLLQRVTEHCAAVAEQGRALIQEVDSHSLAFFDKAIQDQQARLEALSAAGAAGPPGDDTLASLEQRRRRLQAARDRLAAVLDTVVPARATAVAELADAVRFERRARPRDAFDSSVVITMPQTFASRFGPGPAEPTGADEVGTTSPSAPANARIRTPGGPDPRHPADDGSSRATPSSSTRTARVSK